MLPSMGSLVADFLFDGFFVLGCLGLMHPRSSCFAGGLFCGSVVLGSVVLGSVVLGSVVLGSVVLGSVVLGSAVLRFCGLTPILCKSIMAGSARSTTRDDGLPANERVFRSGDDRSFR